MEKAYLELKEILDKEQNEILFNKRSHHTSWDNHILTLSTASLGFCFAFLPLSSGNYVCLINIGLISFVLSIIFTMICFLKTDKALSFALNRNTQSQIHIKRLKKLDEKYTILIEDKQLSESEKTQLHIEKEQKIKKSIDEMNLRELIKEIDDKNVSINFLNQAKTYSFIIGVVLVTAFVLSNLDKFK